jgi:uracil phosphoribosyltransferase
MKPPVVIEAHPLVRHHLGIVRDRNSSPCRFRHSIRQLAGLLAVEGTRELGVRRETVETPLASCPVDRLAERIGLVPILRAGIMMVDPLLELIPDAEVWHLGLYRDEETAEPVPYYNKLPAGSPVDLAFVLDPMLATGGSACMACQSMVEWGVREARVLSVIAAPEGVQRLTSQFPDVRVFACCIDQGLNDRKFIVPGLGDAGDRVFNTL